MLVGNLMCVPVPIDTQQGQGLVKYLDLLDLLGVESKGNEYLISPVDVHVSL